jgi:hypothetical protein
MLGALGYYDKSVIVISFFLSQNDPIKWPPIFIMAYLTIQFKDFINLDFYLNLGCLFSELRFWFLWPSA